MKKADEIYQKFVGSNKIQPLNIMPGEKGHWILRYKEGRTTGTIEFNDRDYLDKILIEFGGKNPETCRAPDKFLQLDGWRSSDISDLGHRITKVKISGHRLVRSTSYPVIIPENCGVPPLVGAKRKEPNSLDIRLIDRELVDRTLIFKTRQEFDNLCDFVLNHKALGKLSWHVMLMGTESRETGDQCVWKRLKAGDGTKRMVLELVGLNGVHFTDCVRQDLFDAASDMFHSPCQRVRVKRKKEQTMEICMFAAEDGKIDVDDLEAVE